ACALISNSSPARTTAWSSASTICSLLIGRLTSAARFRMERDMHIDRGGGAWGGLDVELPTGPRRALGHAGKPKRSTCAGRVRHAFKVETTAVVLDDRAHFASVALDDQAHVGCLSVLEDVGQRLLHDAIDSCFYRHREPPM